VVGQHTLDQTLSETDQINLDIRKILDLTTADWGVQVTLVELKDAQLPDSMKRAMARQAEAEREKRAKIINAARSATGQRAGEQTRPRPARGLPAGDEHWRRHHSGRGWGDLAVCYPRDVHPRPECARHQRHRDAGRRHRPAAVAAGLGPVEPSP
jgi:SPFH domain / Band 7 family